MQYVITPVKAARTFDCDKVQRFFHHAESVVLAGIVAANGAWVFVCEVTASFAGGDSLMQASDGASKT